jgi:hypothetical protein
MPRKNRSPLLARGAQRPGGLLGALLRGLSRSAPKENVALAPPGQRSGSGTESLEAYLEQGRHSRPGPLE